MQAGVGAPDREGGTTDNGELPAVAERFRLSPPVRGDGGGDDSGSVGSSGGGGDSGGGGGVVASRMGAEGVGWSGVREGRGACQLHDTPLSVPSPLLEYVYRKIIRVHIIIII